MSALSQGLEPGGVDVVESIARAIERHGYAIIDQALPVDLVDRLFRHICGLPENALLRAGIGRETDHHLNRFVRGDETCWLEPELPVNREFLAWMEKLRLGINQRLFLGLFDYEAHYARYQPGAFYRRHYDAFAAGDTNRILSTVLYLNPHWTAMDGGELQIFAERSDGILAQVQPTHGRLVVFLSERFAHEVLTTRRMRYSIAGWFRVNTSLGGCIDPPR